MDVKSIDKAELFEWKEKMQFKYLCTVTNGYHSSNADSVSQWDSRNIGCHAKLQVKFLNILVTETEISFNLWPEYLHNRVLLF